MAEVSGSILTGGSILLLIILHIWKAILPTLCVSEKPYNSSVTFHIVIGVEPLLDMVRKEQKSVF